MSTPYSSYATHFWAWNFKQIAMVYKRKIGGHPADGIMDPVSVLPPRAQGKYQAYDSPMTGILRDQPEWGT